MSLTSTSTRMLLVFKKSRRIFTYPAAFLVLHHKAVPQDKTGTIVQMEQQAVKAGQLHFPYTLHHYDVFY